MTIQKNNDYCVHGKYVGNLFTADYMCHMCEDGYLYRKQCAQCDLSFWARSNDTIKHHAGNPLRAELAATTWKFRRSLSVAQVKHMRELWRVSVSASQFYSRYVGGNFESKNLHSLSEV